MKCSLKSSDEFITYGVRVDQDGDVLDILVQSKRDKKAAKKFFRKCELSSYCAEGGIEHLHPLHSVAFSYRVFPPRF